MNIKLRFVGYLYIILSISTFKAPGFGWHETNYTLGALQGPTNITRHGTKYIGLSKLTPWICAALVSTIS